MPSGNSSSRTRVGTRLPKGLGSTLIERARRLRKVSATLKTAVNVMRTVGLSEEMCFLMTSGHFQKKDLHPEQPNMRSIEEFPNHSVKSTST
jgi:hypothetical protein